MIRSDYEAILIAPHTYGFTYIICSRNAKGRGDFFDFLVFGIILFSRIFRKMFIVLIFYFSKLKKQTKKDEIQALSFFSDNIYDDHKRYKNLGLNVSELFEVNKKIINQKHENSLFFILNKTNSLDLNFLIFPKIVFFDFMFFKFFSQKKKHLKIEKIQIFLEKSKNVKILSFLGTKT